MPIESVEGLLVTLLLLVRGFGIEFRRWVYPSKNPSPFAELLHALGVSGAALIVLEARACRPSRLYRHPTNIRTVLHTVKTALILV